jgi:hypothetical protein
LQIFFAQKIHFAVSRMISRSGVCGLNFTKRSSFSTSGLPADYFFPSLLRVTAK